MGQVTFGADNSGIGIFEPLSVFSGTKVEKQFRSNNRMARNSKPRQPARWSLTPLALLALAPTVVALRTVEDPVPWLDTQTTTGQSAALSAGQVVSNPGLVHARLSAKNPHYRDRARFAFDPKLGLVGDLSECGVEDLTPLTGIPFEALDLKGLQVSDLAPLRGMPLRLLGLEGTLVQDLAPLAGMKIEKLYLNNTRVTDLRPLTGLPIKELMLVGTGVKDLRPLQKMPLQSLWLNQTPVDDITSLARCPLVSLTLERTHVADLRPLSKMPSLRRLHVGETEVRDLTPLRGLALTRLIFSPKTVRAGVEVVRSMKTLTELGTTFETRMPPEQFWLLYDQGRIR